jgi:holliday junction DNA helicase RuvA
MIGKLTGTVDAIGADHAIVDVGGVGYLVHCPSSTLSKLVVGGVHSFFVETRVGEDAIRLYGFATSEEREWFKLLQSVQNVGARVALNVLSALSARELERAIILGDKATIGRAQGVGPKLALRIVTELKDKAPAIELRVQSGAPHAAGHPARTSEIDAVSALVKLGYTQSQAAEAVARAARDIGEAPADQLILESLRAMAR